MLPVRVNTLKALAEQSQRTACMLRQHVIYSQQAAAKEDLKNNCDDQLYNSVIVHIV